ncbi:MAG: flagellar motor switch protein FliG [Calditrichaeota bacterium]|nr:MAG: flagellar motor switch protein FliG [Calditrichota bacterium]
MASVAIKKRGTEEELTGKRKAAILLISLQEDVAASVMKHLNRQEVLKLSTEIAKIESVLSSTINKVNEEFLQMIKAQEYVASGGLELAQNFLEKALGLNEAKEVVEKLRANMQSYGFSALRKADASQLSNFLIKEHPQTIALILSYLEPSQTADVLAEFPEDLRADVAYRIATLGKISPHLLSEIEEVIESLAESVLSEGMSKTGGSGAVAEILNQANKATEQSILAHIEEVDPELAMEIKSQMFVFDDLIMIDDRGIQKILKNVDKKDLALALKAADEEIKEKIFNNMSERAASLLKEDLEVMGPVRLSEVEDAQRRIIEIVKQLEDEGEIVISGRGKEDVIIS